MVLTQEQIANILARMQKSDLKERLDALNESVKIRKEIFKDCNTIDEWARAALIIEQLYAFTCEILNVRPIRIKELEETDNIQLGEKAVKDAYTRNFLAEAKKTSRPSKGRPKTKKVGVGHEEFSALLSEFKEFLNEEKS